MRILFILLVLLTFNVSAQNESETDNQVSTYYLIRHAEKDQSDKSNRNPNLTEKGLQRADNWAKVFFNVDFDMVYSTQYNRTIQTATPTAKANNLEIQFYNPRDFKLDEFKEKTM